MKLAQVSLLLALMLTSAARAGHESHGSDNNVDSLAWFLGEGREIQYCLESTARFRLEGTEEEMRKAIEDSFKQWVDYVNVRKIDTNYFPKELWPQLTYAKKLKWTGKPCDANADLTFYFGVDNAQTREARARFDDPVALTYIPKYDPKTSWQKGFVWIADPYTINGTVNGEKVTLNWWEESDVLNVLLHEWGHIFGNGHIQGTVMDSWLKEMLLAEHAKGGELREPTIDGTKELYVLLDVVEEYYVGSFFPEAISAMSNFIQIMGRQPQGEITIQIHFVKPLVSGEPSKSTFQIGDKVSALAFPMEMLFNSPTVFLGEEIFRRRLPNGEVYFDRHSATSVRGYVHFPMNGIDRNYAISVETNTSVGEPAGGTAQQMQKKTRPVQVYSFGLQQDVGRGLIFSGEHVTPPGGYRLLTDLLPPKP